MIGRIVKRWKIRLTAAEYLRISYLHPRSVVLVTTRSNGKDNMLPLDWHIPLSINPKLYAISLESHNHSSMMITESGVFAVNFMGSRFEEQMLLAGRSSGATVDKFQITNLRRVKGVKLDVPILVDALGYLECKLVETLPTGDHTLFIGKVVNECISPSEVQPQLHHVTAGVNPPLDKAGDHAQ